MRAKMMDTSPKMLKEKYNTYEVSPEAKVFVHNWKKAGFP